MQLIFVRVLGSVRSRGEICKESPGFFDLWIWRLKEKMLSACSCKYLRHHGIVRETRRRSSLRERERMRVKIVNLVHQEAVEMEMTQPEKKKTPPMN